MAGSQMPAGWSQDILTRIINVHWSGGGVFIAISADGNIYYLKLTGGAGKEPAWEDLGTLDFVGSDPDHFIPFPAGCAYAMTSVKNALGAVIGKQPVFLIVGGAGNITSPGIIMASRDGKSWSRVFTFDNASDTSQGAKVWAIVWDEESQKFYAGGHASDSFSDFETGVRWQSETDLLFSSSDGFSWSEADRHVTRVDSAGGAPLPPWPEYTTGLLDTHCSKRLVDSHGNGVSDGYYGYDKIKEVMIAPAGSTEMDYFFGAVGVAALPNVAVTFSGEGTPPSYPLVPGLAMVTCVATAGGKWVAAGGIDDPQGSGQPPAGGGKSQAAVLVTNDAGILTWRRLDPPGTNAIIAMCGGLLSDVEPKT